MKSKALTALCAFTLLIPWTILPLRSFPWALESPTAEIMISCYAAFMIFSGLLTALIYFKAKIQHTLMKLCLMINTVYAAFGLTVFILMLVQKSI